MLYGPSLVVLTGDNEPFGFWATAAAGAAKIGARVARGIKKAAKARKKIKAGISVAKTARAAVSRSPSVKKAAPDSAPSSVAESVTVRAGVSPVVLIGGAAVVALLLLGGRK